MQVRGRDGTEYSPPVSGHQYTNKTSRSNQLLRCFLVLQRRSGSGSRWPRGPGFRQTAAGPKHATRRCFPAANEVNGRPPAGPVPTRPAWREGGISFAGGEGAAQDHPGMPAPAGTLPPEGPPPTPPRNHQPQKPPCPSPDPAPPPPLS